MKISYYLVDNDNYNILKQDFYITNYYLGDSLFTILNEKLIFNNTLFGITHYNVFEKFMENKDFNKDFKNFFDTQLYKNDVDYTTINIKFLKKSFFYYHRKKFKSAFNVKKNINSFYNHHEIIIYIVQYFWDTDNLNLKHHDETINTILNKIFLNDIGKKNKLITGGSVGDVEFSINHNLLIGQNIKLLFEKYYSEPSDLNFI